MNKEQEENLIQLPEMLYNIWDNLSLIEVIKFRLSKILNHHVATYLQNELQVKQVSCGKDHTLILLENGRVLAVGDNQYGQLGLGEHQKKVSLPTEILGVGPVQSIATGFYHSILLSKAGTVWVMGDNSMQQLATDSNVKIIFTPEKVKQIGNIKITNVNEIIALDYSTAILGKNIALVWGNKALTSHPFKNGHRLLPAWVKMPKEKNIVDVGFGSDYALFLTDEGILYGIGNARFLGDGTNSGIKEDWFMIQINNGLDEENMAIKDIKASEFGSVILTTKNELMMCGHNTQGRFNSIAKEVIHYSVGNQYMTYVTSSKEIIRFGSQDQVKNKSVLPISVFKNLKNPKNSKKETNCSVSIGGFFKLEKSIRENSKCSSQGEIIESHGSLYIG
jgi:alpha-tubulin suppressor-like RCC1 family protein